jgi:hypothetical protein
MFVLYLQKMGSEVLVCCYTVYYKIWPKSLQLDIQASPGYTHANNHWVFPWALLTAVVKVVSLPSFWLSYIIGVNKKYLQCHDTQIAMV